MNTDRLNYLLALHICKFGLLQCFNIRILMQLKAKHVDLYLVRLIVL